MNPNVKTMWVNALRSGEYKQGTGELRDVENNFCCLGVLCDIYDREKQAPELRLWSNTDRRYYYTYAGELATPPDVVQSWAEIADKSIDVDGQFDTVIGHLWKRNDGAYIHDNHTFPQMADFIEKNL